MVAVAFFAHGHLKYGNKGPFNGMSQCPNEKNSALFHSQNDIIEFVFLAVRAYGHLLWPLGLTHCYRSSQIH